MTPAISPTSSLASTIQMPAPVAQPSAASSQSGSALANAPASATPSSAAAPAASTTTPSAATSSSPTPASAASTAAAPTDQAVDKAVKQMQDYFAVPKETASLEVDHTSGEPYVKIVNANTKQLILQIPSEEVMAMAQKMREMAKTQGASGALVDQEG